MTDNKSSIDNTEKKQRVFSGIKPTGKLTIGNYIGALRNMNALQSKYECFYSVVDLHSLTVDNVPSELRANSMSLFALMLAFGLDKSVLFMQSHVREHAELTWLLNCYTQFGEAKRMTQFKDKSIKAPENVNVGLFDYPVLMAADILLYQADFVPIGADQKQHLELARTIAQRFNNRYSPTFVVPDGIYPRHGAKINSLTDPLAKMGKTDDNPEGVIFVLDKPDEVMRKFKRAVTDSENTIAYKPKEKHGISNLLTIYSAFSGISVEESEKEMSGQSYAGFKVKVAEAVIEGLRPVQEKYNLLMQDKDHLFSLMRSGAAAAAAVAGRTLKKVYRKVGLLLPE